MQRIGLALISCLVLSACDSQLVVNEDALPARGEAAYALMTPGQRAMVDSLEALDQSATKAELIAVLGIEPMLDWEGMMDFELLHDGAASHLNARFGEESLESIFIRSKVPNWAYRIGYLPNPLLPASSDESKKEKRGRTE